MRVVALEEHFNVPALVKRIDPAAIGRRGFKGRKAPSDRPGPVELLPEIGERRLKSMDETGITMQVLSSGGPGPDIVPGRGRRRARPRDERPSGRSRRQASDPLRGLRRAADAEPRRLPGRAPPRGEGA